MSVVQVLVLAVVAILVNQLKNGRSLTLLGLSALVIYWIQPIQEPVNLTFWFPTFTLGLTVVFWLLISTPEMRSWKLNRNAVAVLIGVIVFVDLNRYFQFESFFIADTPRIQLTAVVLLVFAFGAFLLARIRKISAGILVLAFIGLVAVLVFLKTPSALTGLIGAVANLRGKEAVEASALSWLGFSYVAFRLMHTIIDHKAGRLPAVTLADYMNYVIFFPSFSAGPIDRLERFQRNLNQPLVLGQADWVDAGSRLFVVCLKNSSLPMRWRGSR